MRIYSWNMLFKNKELDRAFAFVSNADFDIFCFQEVPEPFLKRLKARFEHVSSASEGSWLVRGSISSHYLVIVSRYPVLDTEIRPVSDRERIMPPRGRLFTRFMCGIGLWPKDLGGRHDLRVDIAVPGIGSVRVHDFHFLLLNPSQHAQEFEAELAENTPGQPTIICGDMNVIESPKVSILNWLLGGTFSEALFWWRERVQMEKLFAKHGLRNPLRGKNTHPLSRSQLDHILISPSFSVKKVDVLTDRMGSDHRPIFAELA